jgi:hypothetical protein
MTQPSRRAHRSPEEIVMRRMRNIGFTLLAAAAIVEVLDRYALRAKLRFRGFEQRAIQRVDNRSARIADLGTTLLESLAAQSANKERASR